MRSLLVIGVIWAAPAAAQTLPRAFDFPTYPLGPSVVALGGAGAAWSPDAAAGLNPATLLAAPRISISHYEGFSDYGGDHAAGSVILWNRFALGLSLRRLGWDRVIEDEIGVPADALRTGDAQYTMTLAAAPIRRLHLGIAAARLMSDNLGVRISATSWSLGTMVTYSNVGQAGLAVLHAGTPARAASGERYALPTTVRAGVRQGILNRLTVVLDTGWPTHGDAWTGHAGVEWRAPAVVVLRAGLESLAGAAAAERETRFAAGLGLIAGPLEVSLTTRFGGIAGSQEWFVGLDALRPRVLSKN